MSRYVLPLIAVVALILFLVVGLKRGDPKALPSPFIGKPAPEFELPTLNDPAATVALNDLKGNFALVNVWATWCAGCRTEHPFLLELAGEKTVPVYGINWRDTRPEALRWIEQLGDPYIASGFDGSGRVGIDWGVYGAPETFLVSAEGVVLHKHLGPLDRKAWERDFVPLIASGGASQ
ncbi:MAG: DsbE family thiol:disulfide interchange protein [Gammaproteobacteria bacterium]|nr:DsbE family thiol:disulfide interchange protein [Gammaproteobacteria bacterium]